MRWTQTLIPTLKETPAEAEIISHKLLLRAGLVRKLTGGLYTFLPLGLRALRKELQKLGDVTVVAPVGEQSAVGHSITLLTPLLIQEVLDDNNQAMGWAVEGRPADCVKLALLELLKDKPPDLIVSGLNAGSNAGIGTGNTYSFTGATTYVLKPNLILDANVGWTVGGAERWANLY